MIEKNGKWYDEETGEELVKISVEETVVQEFFVPKQWDDENLMSEKYKDCEIVVDNPECQGTQYMVTYADGTQTGWMEM